MRKSVVTAGWIVVAAGSVILGSAARDRVDLSSPSHGVDFKNLVASRDVADGGHLQSEIPAGDFFFELTEKLKQEYVEPIGDEGKLASGAVRGMIGYLGDPHSTFMDKDSFRAFVNARQGKYEGIGADFEILMSQKGGKASRSVLQPSPSEDSPQPGQQPGGANAQVFPRLTVTSVVPGGPADRAGVKAGDQVYSVDDHWVINGDLGTKFTAAYKAFKAKQLPLSELNALRKEVRDKYEHMILPLRAKDRLFVGRTGAVKVTWDHSGVQRTTVIDRAPSVKPGFGVNQGTIVLPFVADSSEQLRKAIDGRSSVTIDLRNNTLGDFGAMKKCLSVLAPSGNYGFEGNERTSKWLPIKVVDGNGHPPKVTLLTDRTTRGAADIFALALSSKGAAKLSGSDSGGEREFYDIVSLPDGSGYTLVTGRYRPDLPMKSKDAVATNAPKHEGKSE